MSSSLQIKKVCQHCGKEFIAKKTTTKFCSVRCGQRNYKIRERMNKVESANAGSRRSAFGVASCTSADAPEKLLANIKVLAFLTSMSERMIFRLIKEPGFPKIKIGKKLLFDVAAVLSYLKERYGNI